MLIDAVDDVASYQPASAWHRTTPFRYYVEENSSVPEGYSSLEEFKQDASYFESILQAAFTSYTNGQQGQPLLRALEKSPLEGRKSSLNILKISQVTFDELAAALQKALPEGGLSLEELATYNALHPVEETHRILCSAIEDILDSAATDEEKRSLVAKVLQEFTYKYLEMGFLPSYHSMTTIRKKISEMESSSLSDAWRQIREWSSLNRSLYVLAQRLLHLWCYQFKQPFLNEKLKQEIILQAKNIIKAIDDVRTQTVLHFTIIDMTTEEAFQQKLAALYMAEVNKLKKVLLQTLESLEVTVKTPFKKIHNNLEGKKTVIFTCSFGTGHKITALALKNILESYQCQTVIYDLSIGALLGKNRLRTLCKFFGVYYEDHYLNSVDAFNEILRNQLYFLINTKDNVEIFIRRLLGIAGKDGVISPLGLFEDSWEKAQIRELLLSEGADQIITTYHMSLNPILEIAEELNIPVLHIPTDYHMKYWEVFDKLPPSYAHFKSSIPNQAIEETLQTKDPVPKELLVDGIGIPLRPEFYRDLSDEESRAYRLKHGIEERTKVLYVSAGGNGIHLPHPKLLADSTTWDVPLHVIVTAGRNHEFVRVLQQQLHIKDSNPFILQGSNPLVTVEILASNDPAKKGTAEEFFIDAAEISKVLDITHGSLAKAGGLSVAELLFKGVPLLFDHRTAPFSWELFNINVIVRCGRGINHFSLKNLEEDLRALFQIEKAKNPHFYFQHSRTILVQTIKEQIESAEKSKKLTFWDSPYQVLDYFFNEQERTQSYDIAEQAKRDLEVMTDGELDNNWKLGNYFGEIKLISSNFKGPRFQRCQQELASIGVYTGDYTLFSGVDGSTLEASLWQRADNWDDKDTDRQRQGRMGCFMAHYRAIKDSSENLHKAEVKLKKLQSQAYVDAETLAQAIAEVKKYSSVLILEDNTGFGRVTGSMQATLDGMGRKLRLALQEMPVDWDMFYFTVMADPWGPSEQIAPHLLRLKYGVIAKCYAVNAKMYPLILENLENLIHGEGEIPPIDHAIAILQGRSKCYASMHEGLSYRFGSVSEVQSIGETVAIENWQPYVHKVIPLAEKS